jgi:hypothetical protein
MPRTCEHPDVPQPEICRVCWLYVNDAGYRALYDGMPRIERLGNCIYLGNPILPPGQRTDAIGTVCLCQGKWLHACELHGNCTISEARADVICCQGCPEFEPDR